MRASSGMVMNTPCRSKAHPNIAIEATITSSGRHAMRPIGLPPSVQIVSDLNKTMPPRVTISPLTINGK